MTRVIIIKKNNEICEVECDGHTNYGEKGEDIVCASLSSIVQTAVLGLLMVCFIELDMKRDDVFCISGWSDKVFDILAALEHGENAIDKIRRIVV